MRRVPPPAHGGRRGRAEPRPRRRTRPAAGARPWAREIAVRGCAAQIEIHQRLNSTPRRRPRLARGPVSTLAALARPRDDLDAGGVAVGRPRVAASMSAGGRPDSPQPAKECGSSVWSGEDESPSPPTRRGRAQGVTRSDFNAAAAEPAWPPGRPGRRQDPPPPERGRAHPGRGVGELRRWRRCRRRPTRGHDAGPSRQFEFSM